MTLLTIVLATVLQTHVAVIVRWPALCTTTLMACSANAYHAMNCTTGDGGFTRVTLGSVPDHIERCDDGCNVTTCEARSDVVWMRR